MSLLCNSRAEETYSMGCKENGIKTQREGLGDLKHWLRPLVLPPAETANDCKLSSDRCSVMAPVHVLLHKCVHHSPCCRQAYMDKPALAAGFFFFAVSPLSFFNLQKKKESTITMNLTDFSIKSKPFAYISFSLQVLVWAALLSLGLISGCLIITKPNDGI